MIIIKKKSQFLKGILEGCILKIIGDQEVYGYEIAEKLKKYGIKDISEGTIYPLLLRLEKCGYLNFEKKESPYGPKRKYYTLTNEGIRELDEFFKNWNELKINVSNIFGDYKGGYHE